VEHWTPNSAASTADIGSPPPSTVSRLVRDPKVVCAGGFILFLIVLAIGAPLIAPHDPLEQNLLSILVPPAWADGGDLSFPLGTDSLGRCVLSRLIYGARTAMLVAFFASLGAMIIGSVLAHIAGYFGGAVDWLIGRLVDVWMSFPPVVLSLILMVGLGVGLDKVILAIILVDWTRFCRVLRSEVLVVTRHDYVSAARLLGFSHWQAIVREVLPATLPLLITLLSIEMAIAVVVEAILSFVGLGVGADTPAWGQMIADARQYVYQSPWNLLLPALAIFLTVAAFNLLGDGLRRTLDVRLAESGR
jgi:peptide/nickel transport system permease protein